MDPVETGVFDSQPIDCDWITGAENSKSLFSDDQEYPNDKESWSIIIEEISLDYVDKLDKLQHESHILLRLHSDGFLSANAETSLYYCLFT